MANVFEIKLKTPPDANGNFVLTDTVNTVDYPGQIPENSEQAWPQEVRQFALKLGQELTKKERKLRRKVERAAENFNITTDEVLFVRTDEDLAQ